MEFNCFDKKIVNHHMKNECVGSLKFIYFMLGLFILKRFLIMGRGTAPSMKSKQIWYKKDKLSLNCLKS